MTAKKVNGNSGLSANLLPKFYQSAANKKFLQSTIDQLFQPGTISKVSGYIGRENAKASLGSDVFVEAADLVRQHYQLEPSVTIQDKLGNITFFKDYIDYINQINVFEGNVSTHDRLNRQEFYSWDPHIDWDKFVNFQNYYWLPYGPDAITIYGAQHSAESTISVRLENEGSNNQYVFTPDGFSPNPAITLYKGQTYTFLIDSPDNPFSFKTARSTGAYDRYNFQNTLTGQAVTGGTVTFTVPNNAPSILFYQSESDPDLGGAIKVEAIIDNTFIDVEVEVLGKKTYTLPDGTSLSNGMRVDFAGNVSPAKYADGQFYVEGVGTAIKLVRCSDLEISSKYSTSETIEFDSMPFDREPFDDALGYAGNVDYITINRASKDKNPWSRYNRWFHKDVVTISANYNGNTPLLDQTARAVRPIIEFQADIRMFNMGTTAIEDVDLIDTFTTHVFQKIEGTRGYNIDGVNLLPGMTVLFTADTDPLVANKIYKVEYVDVNHISSGSNQIHLVEIATPEVDQVVLVRQGQISKGQSYWFNGTTWLLGQQKDDVNQTPLFDVFDSNGASYGDNSVYTGTTFKGTPIFSYKVSSSNSNDAVLGFPLTYQNVNNIGDIVFTFNLLEDKFEYKKLSIVETHGIDVGFLSVLDYGNKVNYYNGWQTCTAPYVQGAVRVYKNTGLVNNFPIDMFDVSPDELAPQHDPLAVGLDNDDIRVYVNSKRVASTGWSLVKTASEYVVKFVTDLLSTDVVTVKVYSATPINSNGYYEVPVNLQSNALNENITTFTLGEVIDHVDSIIDNIYQQDSNGIIGLPSDANPSAINGINYVGVFPGNSNLRDLGNITQYGTKFVQHSGPMSLSLYHLTSEDNNVIRALEQANDDYNTFKRNFIITAGSLGVDGDPVVLVDTILQKINANKPTVAPYYFSDMVPYGACVITNLTVVDRRIKVYPLSAVFTLDNLSNKAVGVYLNGKQLIHGKEYTFSSQGFVVIDNRTVLADGDIISTYEYDNTDGCFIPATPTKLGMWPKFEPKKYLDTSLIYPKNVIQGHDGSIIAAYNDYRDDLILELEKRIFNNIKVSYDPAVFDIADFIPSYNRASSYSKKEFDKILAPNFFKWTGLVGKDLTTPLSYDRTNTFTFNYANNVAPDGRTLPGYWRGVYRWALDTDRPHLCPWEMLGFSEEPSWWQDVYGPAPYTSNNIPMWTDISRGLVKEPGKAQDIREKYVKPFLLSNIPVDESGNLISPQFSGFSKGTIQPSIDNNFVFGDGSPVESAWTRSSYYPFSVIKTALLMRPAQCFGVLLDKSRAVRNIANQLVYSETGLRIQPADILLPSVYSSSSRVQTAGLINYVVDLIFNYIFSNNVEQYKMYASDLGSMNLKLSYRLGAFTNKDHFNFLLESKTPSSTGSVFIPAEDFTIFLNKSSTVRKLVYSGVMVTKSSTGFEVKGYSFTQPYFKCYKPVNSGVNVNVGGISENYSTWSPNNYYLVGSVIQHGPKFYRVKVTHTSSSTFDASYVESLPYLPMIGGVNALFKSSWDKSEEVVVPYGTKFEKVQDVVDFLLGYGEWLTAQGFEFNAFNKNLGMVANWGASAKEFMFWTAQNWSTGQEKWSDWQPAQPYSYGTIVRYEGDYYSALYNIPESTDFDYTKWNMMPGLSNVGSSVISLSPAANGITFTTDLAVVDNIENGFNPYELVKVDGTPIKPTHIDSYRDGNTVTYTPRVVEGIFGASFHLVQNEHVAVINNTTIFNDIIYSNTSGYRQERLKVSGYVTQGWYGGLDIPGFIFDAAQVQEWQPWKDYSAGDVVTHNSYFYSADSVTPGTETFARENWTQLKDKPSSQILPNWTNIATQFTDFYSLDVDSFDSAQQQMGQHAIGYQKRPYLNNIIQDDVSEFKFYQGMIREKGTQNVLSKLFDVLKSENKESLTFYEEWALRVGQYGATNAFENVEILLNEGLFNRSNPQAVALVNKVDPTLGPFVIQQTPNDVYVKPLGYNSNPFPVLKSEKSLLRSAGYVNTNDVYMSVGRLSDLVSQPATMIVVGKPYKILTAGTTDFTSAGAISNAAGTTFVATSVPTGTGTVAVDPSNVTEGTYFWTSFDAVEGWDVYRFTDINLRITDATYNNGVLTITTQDLVTLPVGSYIGIAQYDTLNGFYEIKSVTLNSFTVDATIADLESPFTHQDRVVLFALVSQRTSSIDEIDSVIPKNLSSGNILWTDDRGDGNWASWSYSPVYSESEVSNPLTGSNYDSYFGENVAINKQGTVASVCSNLGIVIIYDKVGTSVKWVQRQIILPTWEISQEGPLLELGGRTSAFSNDGAWLAVSDMYRGRIYTFFKGAYDSQTTYTVGQVVVVDGVYYKALLNNTGKTPSTTSNFWIEVPYISADTASEDWYPAETAGVVFLYKKDATGVYSLVDILMSPEPVPFEQFGTELVFADNDLYVSATGYGYEFDVDTQTVTSQNKGRVYKLTYDTKTYFSTSYNEVGSSGKTLKLTSTAGVYKGMSVIGAGFTSNQTVSAVLTKLVFPSIINVANSISSAAGEIINLSTIYPGMSVSGLNVLPGVEVVSTGTQKNSTTNVEECFVVVQGPRDMFSGVNRVTFGNSISYTFIPTSVESLNTAIISSVPDSTPIGVLSFAHTTWRYDTVVCTGTDSNEFAGTRLALSEDNSTLLVSSGGIGQVNVYKNSGTEFTLSQTLEGLDANFGQSITLSDSAEYIAIGNDISISSDINQTGTVGIYKRNSTTGLYVKDVIAGVGQDLVYHNAEFNGHFGNKISFMNDDKTLVVYSRNASTNITTTFDATNTTFDKRSTRFSTLAPNTGRVDIYDRYNKKWVFSESLSNNTMQDQRYGTGFAVGSNNIIIGVPFVDINSDSYEDGIIKIYNKKPNTFSWTQSRSQVSVVDISKVKSAFLYNRKTEQLLTYLDVIDPLQGKVAGPADEEIKYKAFYDPASYSYSDGTVNVNTDSTSFWSVNQVNQVWWDLRTTKFVMPYFNDITYRNNMWNTLAPGASVDIYEWVSTSLLPSEWDAITDTPAGLAQNISGTTLYGDSAYSVRKRYNTITKAFTNTYYYWVKNSTLVPAVQDRHLSAQQISSLIGNPRNQAYTHLGLIGTDSVSISNCLQYLQDTDTVLSVEYWNVEGTDKNIHSQWKLISTDTIVDLPHPIEQKWFDSLCGVDSAGRAVPDINLPVKLKYGIENRPRQSMFVNRVEALKQFVERTNIFLLQEQIAERDISSLNDYDKEPSILTGLYDAVLDTDKELPYATVNLFKRPVLTPIITNGRITGITIVDPGKGYLVAPYIVISGSGVGAVVRAVIDSLGRIVEINVLTQGEGYDSYTIATVRDYCVLVHSDEAAIGSWSVYSFDPTYEDPTSNVITGRWSRLLTQSYDVRSYWTYVDWYDTTNGYNQFSSADYVVPTYSDLSSISSTVGQLVKVATTELGGWVLLTKYADSDSIDWTASYKVVGIQNGTIQLSSSLYKTEFSAVGYDASTFDTGAFDVKASKELRIILDALKNKIFVNDLKGKYLELFFLGIRYAHSEQMYLDWVFKTSFIRATHNVGELDQPVYYPVDNLNNFQDYIDEVKPYRTTIREYISNYTKLDNTHSAVTDFDLPPVFVNGQLGLISTEVVDGKAQANLPAITSYPWKFWLDNVGFEITELRIVDGGSGYITKPTITIDSNSGSGAEAEAFFTNGVINRIIIKNSGSGYLSAPTITLKGGLAPTGKPAKIVAIIGNGVVRSNLVSIKFDRVSGKQLVTNLNVSETFTGSGSKLQFPLKWAPNISIGSSSVSINGIPVLRELYKLTVKSTVVNGATEYSGAITFETAPSKGSKVVVSYLKNASTLSAADRIAFGYNPVTGELGNDLPQLMSGVDYGGTIVGNLGFNVSGGWSETPYATDKWNNYDSSFTDYIVSLSGIQSVFELPYTPTAGTELNVYVKPWFSVDRVSDGVDKLYFYNFYTQLNEVYAITNVLTESNSDVTKTFGAVGTVTQAVSTSVAGAVGQAVLSLSNVYNIQPGQFVSTTGIGISSNTVVVSVDEDKKTVLLSNNLTHAAVGNYTFFSLSTVLTLSDTTSIVVGMGVVGSGFTTQTVTKVVDSTTINISQAPSYIPVAQSDIHFVSNAAGAFDIKVNDVTNLQVGDIISCDIENAVGYNTVIVAKDEASSTITLDNILYTSIPAGATITATRMLNQPIDVVVYPNGNVELAEAAPAGTIIRVTGQYDPFRLDAPDFDEDTMTSETNPNAIMRTLIANGSSSTFITPTTYFNPASGETTQFRDGDIIIIRQSTSDGSITPSDYDTDINGGDLAYNIAAGISADDIVLDGDGFVTPTSSPAPEEVVPGQVVDTLAIKVFDRPSSGSANIKVDSFLTDGTSAEFTLSEYPNTSQAVIVKLDQQVLTAGVDYTVEYPTKTVKLVSTPDAKQFLSVFVIGFAGTGLLDLDYFVGNGATFEFITKAPWTSNIQSVVYVNGVAQDVSLFRTDESYDLPNLVGIRFPSPPNVDALINYIIVNGSKQTFVTTHTEKVIADGGNTYTLQFPVGTSLPNEDSMIVRVGQNILKAPINQYFKISNNRLKYTVDSNRAVPYSTSATDVQVFADGNLLSQGVDYTLDLGGIFVKLTKPIYRQYLGKQLTICVRSNVGYSYNPTSNQITFAQSYDDSYDIQVTSSYQHNVLDIERTAVTVSSTSQLVAESVQYYQFAAVQGGIIILDRSVIDENYVWVTKNETLLVPGVDYRLEDDHITVILTDSLAIDDEVMLMTFSSNVIRPSIAYMQFKDMLNRTTFKRLSLKKHAALAQDLRWNDTTIVLDDASAFELPDTQRKIPGVIEIRGERIEYYAKSGNVLSRLRRATAGTGIVNFAAQGTSVQEIGFSETVPYKDTIQTTKIVSNGSHIVNLSFAPEKGNQDSTSVNYEPTGVVNWFKDDGYTFVGSYSSASNYGVNTVVVYNNLYYCCIKTVPTLGARSQDVDYSISNSTYWKLYTTSIPVGYGQCDSIEVFVGGYDDTAVWSAGVDYSTGIIVNVGSHTYRCIADHTSSSNFLDDTANWSLFVGNIRLKKKPYYVHNENLGPYSNSSTDVRLDADFAVNGTSQSIRLTNLLSIGTTVTVVKRTGVAWDSTVNILNDDSKIAEFIKAEPGIWYESVKG